MEAKKPKRTPEQVRKYVKEQAIKDNAHFSAPPGTMTLAGSSRGSMISGVDLVRAKPVIDKIPDMAIRRQIGAMFSTFTKYQALQLILEGKAMSQYREIAEQIADKATEIEYLGGPQTFGGR